MASAADFFKNQADIFESENQMLLSLNQYERVKSQLLQDEVEKLEVLTKKLDQLGQSHQDEGPACSSAIRALNIDLEFVAEPETEIEQKVNQVNNYVELIESQIVQ